jgi:hypothetical protein
VSVPRHRSFGSPVLSQDQPLTFDLYGQTFRCVPALQGVVMIEFIAQSASDDVGAGARAMLDFLRRVIRPEDRDRFFEMTNSDEFVVPMETLNELMEWLTEQYAGRPTEGQSPSESGSSTTGPSSTAEQSYPVVPVLQG